MMALPGGYTGLLRPPPGRRRDKRQLSCNSCRQRKRKCDRQKPCSYCIKHHLDQTCTYSHLHAPSPPSKLSHDSSPAPGNVFDDGSQSITVSGGLATPSPSASAGSPDVTDLQLTKTGTGFKDSTHWTAVLSGVTEAKNHDGPVGTVPSETAMDEESSPLEQDVLLFEGCKRITKQELLNSIPPRKECDSLVAFYFRAQEYRSVIHPTEFLKRYNAFWANRSAASVSWIGLLYSIFCLTSQVQSQERGLSRTQNSGSSLLSSTAEHKILAYREKVVQCLVRAEFAKGGPDIMETLVNYLLIESYLNCDSNTGVWLLMGNIIQISIRMGYHRDPRHFKSLSPYQGEMRRRMWAMIYSLDIGFSTRLGLPSSIKHSLSDTLPPRNLQDRDFDEGSTELPAGRPIDELTSSTVLIAKLHVATSIGAVSEFVCNPHPLSYEDLITVNSRLDSMYATIPGPCKFRALSESLLDPPSVIFQRVNFYMHYQRARILVNWKFLKTLQDITSSIQCWDVVVEATLEIIRLQHRMTEEFDVLDASRPTGMVDSCFINNGYYLAASIACYLVQHRKDQLSAPVLSEMRSLLEKSLAIWTRTNDLSSEASKVVAALRIVLGKPVDPSITSTAQGDGGESPGHQREDPHSGYSIFDDLPLMMTDFDAAEFASLPSIPMIDYWPPGDMSM